MLKSLAHPDWPYAGTAHEWRGFVKDNSKEAPSAPAEQKIGDYSQGYQITYNIEDVHG